MTGIVVVESYCSDWTETQTMDAEESSGAMFAGLSLSDIHRACEGVEFWGESPPFRKCLEEVKDALNYLGFPNAGPTPVLLLGEQGVGKTTLARLIHDLSSHKNGRFREINCKNIGENLAESYLFGTVKGAFTEAANRTGVFEETIGGTSFFDEIGNASDWLQEKLLRVMANGEFERVGSNDTLRADCHLILATNGDPDELVERGTLRSDFLGRIDEAVITLPPLRERVEDIRIIAEKTVDNLNRELEIQGLVPKWVSEQVLQILEAHSWPDNVRELIKNLKFAYARVPLDEPVIEIKHFSSRFRERLASVPMTCSASHVRVNIGESLKENTKRLERHYFAAAMRVHDGNIGEIAQKGKIRRGKAYRIFNEMHQWLTGPEKPPEEEIAVLKELAGRQWKRIEEGPRRQAVHEEKHVYSAERCNNNSKDEHIVRN